MVPCELCKNLERNEQVARLAFDFTIEELVASTTVRQCPSCIVILDGLNQIAENAFSVSEEVRRVYAHGYGIEREDTFCLEVYFNDDRRKLELEYFSIGDKPWKAVLRRTSVSKHPLSEEAIEWVEGHLYSCLDDHPQCQQDDFGIMPKRLLKLQPRDSEPPLIHLLETDDESIGYIALSHCWGSSQSLITTTDQVAQHKGGLDWDTIPKTFKDVATLAVRLGIYYLWIDSLCIIQDDSSDWNTESAKMGGIYRNAYLTIAATASSGDSEGCFTAESVTPLRSEFQITGPDSIGVRLAVRQKLPHFETLTSQATKQQFPLLTRAWALQERMLSRRTLHICPGEMVWECASETVCECGSLITAASLGRSYRDALMIESSSAAYTKAGIHGLPPFQYEVRRSGVASGFRVREATAFARVWCEVVEHYSSLRLTWESDRLPALAGLASQAAGLGERYLAGLWESSLPWDLLWRVDGSSIAPLPLHKSVSSPDRTSSWSWVSVHSSVKYWHNLDFRLWPEGVDVATYGYSGVKEDLPPYRALGCSETWATSYPQEGSLNPYGDTSLIVLTCEATYKHALLRYREDASEGKLWSLVVDFDDVHYRQNLEGLVLVDFYPDYDLSQNGVGLDDTASLVFLLLVHPEIALVLQETQLDAERTPNFSSALPSTSGPSGNLNESLLKWDGGRRFKTGLQEGSLYRRGAGAKGLCRRIGISRVSSLLWREYQMDWMADSRYATFNII